VGPERRPQDGRVYAVWTQEVKNESDDMDIMFQFSDDDGATWTAPVRLNDDATTNSQVNPAIAVDQGTGFVAVSWYDARNDLGTGGPGDTDGIPNDDVQMWATFSRDGGATFAPNFQVSEGTSNSSVEVTGSGFNLGDYTHAAFESGSFYTAWSDNSNSTATTRTGHSTSSTSTPRRSASRKGKRRAVRPARGTIGKAIRRIQGVADPFAWRAVIQRGARLLVPAPPVEEEGGPCWWS
jgi:hypothetical protein